MIALVMAGGKAARLKSSCEKPLVKIGGKSSIERIVQTLRSSKRIEETVVATSAYTPKTAQKMRASLIKVIETSGEDYHADMRSAIKGCTLFSPVLVISADLPLITGELIERVITHYERCGKPAMMVVVRAQAYERLGLKPGSTIEIDGERFVPVGINVVDGKRIDEPAMEQEILVLDKAEPVVNINTPADVRVAEKLCAEGTAAES